jgi:hypothetical protein
MGVLLAIAYSDDASTTGVPAEPPRQWDAGSSRRPGAGLHDSEHGVWRDQSNRILTL